MSLFAMERFAASAASDRHRVRSLRVHRDRTSFNPSDRSSAPRPPMQTPSPWGRPVSGCRNRDGETTSVVSPPETPASASGIPQRSRSAAPCWDAWSTGSVVPRRWEAPAGSIRACCIPTGSVRWTRVDHPADLHRDQDHRRTAHHRSRTAVGVFSDQVSARAPSSDRSPQHSAQVNVIALVGERGRGRRFRQRDPRSRGPSRSVVVVGRGRESVARARLLLRDVCRRALPRSGWTCCSPSFTIDSPTPSGRSGSPSASSPRPGFTERVRSLPASSNEQGGP